MMSRFAFATALACAALSAAQSNAAETITVVSGTRGVTIASNGPVAQTFVATDALLTNFGFQFASSIRGATTGSVTFSLLSGVNVVGTALATQTTSLSGLSFRAETSPFHDVFDGSIGLTVGQTYTALLSDASANVSLLFGPSVNGTVDAYAPGTLIKNNSLDRACSNNSFCDANFRFTTASVAAAVPEPRSWMMLVAGFAAAGMTLRRGARKVTVDANRKRPSSLVRS